jgi:hypothetical protein
VGCHLLTPEDIAAFPPSTIILNTEQIFEKDSIWRDDIFQWAARFETWDYSERNLEKLKGDGVCSNAKLLRLGYHPRLERIPKAKVQDIDVLFYGSTAGRRLKIIEDLKASGCNVLAVFNAYGKERDALISRAKIVLNLHHYNSHIFEIVRAFYLMTNSKAVVSEVGSGTSIDPAYVEGILPGPYDSLVDNCLHLLEDSKRREALEKAAHETIARLPQAALMAELLAVPPGK